MHISEQKVTIIVEPKADEWELKINKNSKSL